MNILEIVATAKRTGVITRAQEQRMEQLMWSENCSRTDITMLELLLKGLQTGIIRVESECVAA